MSCWKLEAFSWLFYVKEQKQALKGKPGENFQDDFFTILWNNSVYSDYKLLYLHN